VVIQQRTWYNVFDYSMKVEVDTMAVSYKKLWHILLDRDLKKKDLEEMAGITEYMVRKLTNNEHVTTEVLGKISKALDIKIEDFVEFM
jgi:DNA-binding Xre family transcriptional regulator